MDASSIITQVSKDDDQVNTYPYPLGKVSPKEVRESSPNPLLKKPRRRFLRTLFCCFSRNSNSKSTESSLNNQDTSCIQNSPEAPKYLLDAIRKKDLHKKCMVIDLDETLVHSSFKPINNADFVVPVEIDGKVHQVYVLKRPYVDEFLKRMGELYECILFTASLAKYADPVTDLLDRWGVFRARLFRDSCVFHRGNYVKDLNKLGRDLKKIIIVDNSPASYIFQPDNAMSEFLVDIMTSALDYSSVLNYFLSKATWMVPVASWFDDMTDSELLDLIPFFEKLSKVDNIYSVLCNSNHPFHSSNYSNSAQSSSNMQVNNHTTVIAGS